MFGDVRSLITHDFGKVQRKVSASYSWSQKEELSMASSIQWYLSLYHNGVEIYSKGAFLFSLNIYEMLILKSVNFERTF